MKWETLSRKDASAITEKWNEMDPEDFRRMMEGWDGENLLSDEYRTLRSEIGDCWQEAVTKNQGQKKSVYSVDLDFGIMLFRLFDSKGFSSRIASNDGVWRYLCLKVVPDIVHSRFPGKTDQNADEARYWKTSRRIYLKSLWWYIFLSLQKKQGSKDKYEVTREVLKGNSTDTIVQLVERAGKNGYRVDVYRDIMRYYSTLEDIDGGEKQILLRKVMVLNTARVMTVEPDLMEGGSLQYVKELFGYFEY